MKRILKAENISKSFKITADNIEVLKVLRDDKRFIESQQNEIDILNKLSIQDSSMNLLENIIVISEKISFDIMDMESFKKNILIEIEAMEVKEDADDLFNFGICTISIFFFNKSFRIFSTFSAARSSSNSIHSNS